VTHGAIFLNLKSTDPIRARSTAILKKVGPAATTLLLLFAAGTYLWTDVYARLGANPGLIPLLALGSLLAAGYLIHQERMGWAFVMTTLTILFTVATLFVALFPRVMVSSLDPEWSLTIYNASSTPYTLRIMSIVAAVFVPIVLAYQAWTYWVFRHRITAESHLEY
jgi:cytochrome d ubiquinol oxidase subunit II